MLDRQEPDKTAVVIKVARYWLLKSDGIARFSRFGLVGIVSGLTFACVTFLGIRFFRLDAETASVIGYLVSIPLNFFGNRRFSFRSNQRVFGEILRFLCVHTINMLASKAIMHVVTKVLGLHYFFGIALSIAIIPFLTYLLMSIWVFRPTPTVSHPIQAGRNTRGTGS